MSITHAERIIDLAKTADYSDTSTARNLICTLTDELEKAWKLNDKLIDAVIKQSNNTKKRWINENN